MLNLRKIDKFYLSGGWEHVPKDLKYLKSIGIKAILDVQMLPGDTSPPYIKEEATKVGIDYLAIPMRDDEFNADLDTILESGHIFLTQAELDFPKKKDGILIKCAAGISRSAAVLIYHLCITRRMSYVEALNYVRNKESYAGLDFGASPNFFFARHIKNKFKDVTYE